MLLPPFSQTFGRGKPLPYRIKNTGGREGRPFILKTKNYKLKSKNCAAHQSLSQSPQSLSQSLSQSQSSEESQESSSSQSQE